MQTSPLFIILFRHFIAMFGGWFAANNITGNSTTSILLGLAVIAVPTVWSTVVKWLHLEDNSPIAELGKSEMLRTLLGSLISQGVTAASAWLAVDANNPELLAGALINVGLSKAGLHQKLAFIGAQDALKIITVCLCMLSLSSCATTSAILASPFGRAMIATADQMGKLVVETTERSGLEQIILQASAKVSALKAAGADADAVKEALRIAQIAGFTGVIEAAQAKYKQLTGKRFTLPKNPVKVMPVAALRAAPHQNRLKPELHSDDGPGCMQLAERIPEYG